ncbi:Flp family type IVb pilin [Microvenator marinus]|jgi:Flp pilus assembly pilin Flp|uniref:Flp family type IVb pilin n=1 Tax=Microvenator marinus TaxID=2600177 RepID=A0A5B8XUW0_9DELT|nr:Flp family type IVb pilin [Microvenator marinus]QED27873.1 Flp family type IVb pilin [Microvenator marinus]
MNARNILETFHNNEDGATSTEYIVLLILIACFVIGIVKVFGNTLSEKYQAADELIMKEVRF